LQLLGMSVSQKSQKVGQNEKKERKHGLVPTKGGGWWVYLPWAAGGREARQKGANGISEDLLRAHVFLPPTSGDG